MPPLTLNQAAKACHRSKATILSDIRSGRLSAGRDGKNQWAIDPAELFRVYQQNQPETGNENRYQPVEENRLTRHETALIDALREQIELLRQQAILDREQLAREREQADHWRNQATMLLTHDRPEQAENSVGRDTLLKKLFGRGR